MHKLISTIARREHAGQRLDQVISKLLPEYSRSRIQGWIKEGQVTVNDQRSRQRDTVHNGDIIKISARFKAVEHDKAEKIPLNIIYRDEAIILLNKPAGLVVHPGAGNSANTLVNALLHYDNELRRIPRAGIVHRLDKDTTGIILVARTPAAHTFLINKLQTREIKREYQALVCGRITAGGSIVTEIGRHRVRRTLMAVTHKGKPAVTHYRLLEKFRYYTLLRVMLETGRTHQIRVHMSHIRHPIVGDPVYGKNRSLIKGISSATRDAVINFRRQALHAWKLTLSHPNTQEICSFQADLPEDMRALLAVMKIYDHN